MKISHLFSLFPGLLLTFVGDGLADRATADPGGSRPNVIVVFADDLGYGDLGCFGHPFFQTPHLDRMAAEGARLTQFYTTAPYCAPSRAALLTGRYQFRSGVLRNPAPDAGIDDVGMPASEITLGEAFQAAGYQTACIGKWHLGHRPEFSPTRHGFHEYLGILYSNDMRPVELRENERRLEYPLDQRTLTRRYTERAVDFIRRHRDQPFFLYLPHAMPHKPLAASESFYRKSGGGLYGDVIQELDWGIGQIFKTLTDLKLDERTLVIFTSDNGPWFGGSTGGLRGMKGSSWEGGFRVPLIARWPGRIPAGHVNDAPAATIDLFVTVLGQAGITLPGDRVLDGRDIWPLLTGPGASPHEALFCIAGNRLMCVRSGRWKLHVHAPGSRPTMSPGEEWIDPRAPDGVTILAQQEQAHPSQYPGVLTGVPGRAMTLHDLAQDPAEQEDVSALHPEVVERLRGVYNRMAAQWEGHARAR